MKKPPSPSHLRVPVVRREDDERLLEAGDAAEDTVNEVVHGEQGLKPVAVYPVESTLSHRKISVERYF